jgi:hypothetical protein
MEFQISSINDPERWSNLPVAIVHRENPAIRIMIDHTSTSLLFMNISPRGSTDHRGHRRKL